MASPDSIFGSVTQSNSLAAAPDQAMAAAAPGMLAPPDPYSNDQQLLELFDKLKREAMDNRWVWEREWLRDLYYVGNRQWIFFHPTRREWVDKRLQKWVPRPVTNKMAETVQAIRATLAAINLIIVARPVGSDTESIAAAQICDQLSPLIHEEHSMNQVMREADFWLITTGNSVLQLSWDKDKRFNQTFIQSEQCAACGTISTPQAIIDAGNVCPACGNNLLEKAVDPTTGEPVGESIANGKGKTAALSPFEYAFKSSVTRWDELPYIIRLRWRDRHWFETNKPDLVSKITWEKSPSDRSLQIFKSLALSNDIGTGTQFSYLGSSGSDMAEGIVEYELWLKPTIDFPSGLVLRVIGDKNPIVLRVEEESVPGPFPYKDIKGNPLFPFVHAQYEHMGGRLWGRSAVSPLIQKQDQLNQLDSLVQLIIQRMANPVWVIPEDAGIDNITGEPGLMLKWRPQAAMGNAKPERIEGSEVPASLFSLREQLLKDIEDLSGAFDILKGQKPTGIEAFSALQLLVERSQSRFTAVFQSRGEMYRKWFSMAIELERQFGPQERTYAVVEPNKGYTFHHFQNAQLQGQVNFVIEDGSNMPKTALGKRAAIEQANQLGLLNPQDPEQRTALLTQFGLSDLSPTLNAHVQTSLQIQDEFEEWAKNPTGPPPLDLKPWYDLQIHWVERIKWLNTDRVKELLKVNPLAEQFIMMHLQQMQMMLAPPAPQVDKDGKPIQPQQGQNAPGGGQAMTQSNQQSGSPSGLPSGNNQTGPNVGPQ